MSALIPYGPWHTLLYEEGSYESTGKQAAAPGCGLSDVYLSFQHPGMDRDAERKQQ